MLGLFIKAIFSLLALALIAWALVPGLDPLKVAAVAIGLSLLVPIGYPYVRGVKKGDGLIVVKGNVETILLFNASSCVALDSGKKGDIIGVMLQDGMLAQATVIDYEGFITPAKVRITQEQKQRTVDGVTVI